LSVIFKYSLQTARSHKPDNKTQPRQKRSLRAPPTGLEFFRKFGDEQVSVGDDGGFFDVGARVTRRVEAVGDVLGYGASEKNRFLANQRHLARD